MHLLFCQKEIEYKVVKKKWDSWLSKNLVNLQESIRSKNRFLRRLQCFSFEKNWIDIKEDRNSQFSSGSHYFF